MNCRQSSRAADPSCNVEAHKIYNVMFLCNEWKSSKGGLSTFNREFAVNLAKTSSDSIKVHCYVSQSDELDREDARQHEVNLITAKSIPGSTDGQDWLKIPPTELPHPDVVVGHGRKFGNPAFFIVQTAKCKWVQFVHVFCEDLGKYKLTESGVVDTIEENEQKHKIEIALCREADAVVAVGSRLQQKYSRSLPNVKIEIITPGTLEKFSSEPTPLTTMVKKKFNVFMFGRGTFEDLTLKGYDVIANAIGSLGKKFELTFVGSPTGEHRKIEQWFLDKTCISRNQITIRSYCNMQDELKWMFQESDLVVLPSRTEGFGLVALEAISAGVPVLVTDESGIAEALEKVEGGESVIVESDDAAVWAERIQQLSSQSPEERENNAKLLRENYKKTYSWSVECEKFKRMIQDLLGHPHDACESATVLAERPGTHFADKEDRSGKDQSATGQGVLQNHLPGSSGSTISQTTLDVNADKDETQSAKNEDWRLLHLAVRCGNVTILETMLSRGVDIHSKDSDGNTPLMMAAFYGKMEAVNYLLDKGADPSLKGQYGRNLLHNASQGGNVAIIETMLSRGLDINSKDSHGNTPLIIAVLSGKTEAVNYLLDKGADPSLKGQYGRNSLHWASNGGSVAIIETTLSHFDINSKDSNGDTPLLIAAFCGKMEAVNYLLDKGADPSVKGQYGRNLLHNASQGGNVAIMGTMLSRGLDINSKDSNGDTPLMVAAFCGKMEAVNYLLDKGADLSLKGKYGRNSLHQASYGGNVAIIETMLSRGLDINSKDNDGNTALMIAVAEGYAEAVKYLVDRGAR